MGEGSGAGIRFECSEPILRVENMEASLAFYVNLLGFENASWGNEDFTHIARGDAGIYLCRGDQGRGQAWSGSEWRRSKRFMRNTSRVV